MLWGLLLRTSMTAAIEQKTREATFIDWLLHYFRERVSDTYERTSQSLDEKTQKKASDLLNQGIWYPYDYYQALKKFQQTKRLKWLVEKGATFHGFMPPSFFRPVKETNLPSKHKLCCFQVKSEVLPSVALDEIPQSLCILGCSEVQDIAFYQSLRKTLGREKMDHLFSSTSPFSLQIGERTSNPISRLFQQILIENESFIQRGDLCYYSNINEYIYKHPAGAARGFYVICSGYQHHSPQYLGHGLDPQGVSRKKVEETLLHELNAPPEEEDFLSSQIWSSLYSHSLLCEEKASRAFVHSYGQKTFSWKEFEETPSRLAGKRSPMEGKLYHIIHRPDLKRIQILVETSLEDIREVFAYFKKSI